MGGGVVGSGQGSGCRVGVGVGEQEALSLAAPAVAPAPSQEYCVWPRIKRRVATELMDVGDGGQQRFLNGVLGKAHVAAEQEDCRSKQTVGVPSHEFVGGLFALGPKAVGQRILFGGTAGLGCALRHGDAKLLGCCWHRRHLPSPFNLLEAASGGKVAPSTSSCKQDFLSPPGAGRLLRVAAVVLHWNRFQNDPQRGDPDAVTPSRAIRSR